jgi:hypothetical protein
LYELIQHATHELSTLTTSKPPYLEVLLRIPDFPETEADASNLLAVVRSRREQFYQQRQAAEQAVYWSNIRLSVLQEKSAARETINQCLTELQTDRTSLTTAVEALAQADLDVGMVHTLIRRKGLPVVNTPGYIPHTSPAADGDTAISSISIETGEDYVAEQGDMLAGMSGQGVSV